MAITSLDQVIAGARAPVPILKNSMQQAAAQGHTCCSTHFFGGTPAANGNAAPGVAGIACLPTAQSYIKRDNPAAGQNAYLSRLQLQTQQPATVWMVDRLWHNSGLSPTLTTVQAVNSVALPARDENGATLGDGVMAAVEWFTASGAGSPTLTLNVVFSDGTTGTVTTTAFSALLANRWELFGLPAGKKGIRSIGSYQASATRTSGTFNLILYRHIAGLEIGTAKVAALDPITGGMPRIFDNSCLQFLLFPTDTTTTTLIGSYQETHG